MKFRFTTTDAGATYYLEVTDGSVRLTSRSMDELQLTYFFVDAQRLVFRLLDVMEEFSALRSVDSWQRAQTKMCEILNENTTAFKWEVLRL